ncbi:MAG: transcriptional repressor, partial [Christensenellaceae bacterium]
MIKRNTLQKKLVLESVNHLQNHPTADDVYDDILKEYPHISKGTVYRNLNALAQESVLKKISIPNAADRFDHKNMPHYHIKCLICGDFFDVDFEYMTALNENIASLTGFVMQ